jgi:hypothetical protein
LSSYALICPATFPHFFDFENVTIDDGIQFFFFAGKMCPTCACGLRGPRALREPSGRPEMKTRVTGLGDFSPLGRFFASWAIVYFGQLFNYLQIQPKILGHIFQALKLCVMLSTNELGHVLGDCFTTPSGHPDEDGLLCQDRSRRSHR